MNKKYINLLLVSASAILIGCGGEDNYVELLEYNKSISINDSEDYKVEHIGKGGKFNVEVDLGTTPRDLYVLFTNRNSAQSQQIDISHNAKILADMSLSDKISNTPYTDGHSRVPMFVREFYDNLSKTSYNKTKDIDLLKELSRSEKIISYAEGDTKNFYVDNRKVITATLKKQIIANTKFGQKRLNVWLDNDDTETTQAQIDALAEQFLKAGDDDDIYDWVTNIFGEEWGSAAHSKNSALIEETDEINILLYDIGYEGVAGFFYPNDNYINNSWSNQCIMFYIDAPMLDDNAGYGGAKEVYSTLAHEFQHMIHFYQKTVLKLSTKQQTDPWIEEMLSETTEYMIATKLEHTGPRGIDPNDGSAGDINDISPWARYWWFDDEKSSPLIVFDDEYAKVNAFGAFLALNYGGAETLRKIVQNSEIDEKAITNIIDKDIGTLLREWGIAVLLSDIDNVADTIPTYNTGDFRYDTSTDISYELGSINFYNYNLSFNIYQGSLIVKNNANSYYKVGNTLTGKISLELSLPKDIEATLIIK